jgi:hypothetical protein
MIAYAREAFDEDRHPRQSPQGRGKALGLRTLAQGGVDLPQLRPIQLWLAAGPARPAQRRFASAAPRSVPAHDTLPTYCQAPGNGGMRLLARRKEAGGHPSTNFQAAEIPSLSHVCAHASW